MFIRTIRSMFTANRKPFWRSARSAFSSRFLLERMSDQADRRTASTWRLSLAEAVAKAGGLSDDRADPASVFLYRGETRDVAEALGIDCSPFEGPIIPVIYVLNLRDPAGYFLASTFEMRNKDVIYVSNAYSVENTKFLTYLRTINSTVNDPINTAISVYTLKNLIRGTGTVTTSVLTGSAPIITVPSGP